MLKKTKGKKMFTNILKGEGIVSKKKQMIVNRKKKEGIKDGVVGYMDEIFCNHYK